MQLADRGGESPRRRPVPRHPRRTHYPNLSPTRRPTIPADANLWPGWTDVRFEQLGFDLADHDGPEAGAN